MIRPKDIWSKLQFVDAKTSHRKEIVRLHGDILDHANLGREQK
jgi:hypothetical protein